MHSPVSEKVRNIKFARKESFLTRELIPVIEQTLRESPCLEKVYVTRVELSKEGGCINIYVWSMDNVCPDRQALDALKHYRPAFKKLAADVLCSKWTPDVVVRVDQKVGVVRNTNDLMDKFFEQEREQTHTSLEEIIESIKKTTSEK